MPSISSCPFCQVQVAVPAGTGPSDEVRCPLCQAQFSLEEVLDIALPELIVVRQVAPLNVGLKTGADAPLLGGGLLGASMLGGSGGSLAGGGLREGTLMNFSAGEFNGHELGAATLDASTAGIHDDGAGGYSLSSHGSEGPTAFGKDKAFSTSGESWGGGQDLNAASTDMPESGIEAGFAATDTEGLEGAAGIAATPRKKRKETNAFMEMVKAIFGGAIGLTVAYAILLWGCSRDPLQIGGKLPKWMVPTKMQSKR